MTKLIIVIGLSLMTTHALAADCKSAAEDLTQTETAAKAERATLRLTLKNETDAMKRAGVYVRRKAISADISAKKALVVSLCSK
jgi:hypothetical protein